MSALLPKADIAGRQLDVRFVPIADISSPGGPRSGIEARAVHAGQAGHPGDGDPSSAPAAEATPPTRGKRVILPMAIHQ